MPTRRAFTQLFSHRIHCFVLLLVWGIPGFLLNAQSVHPRGDEYTISDNVDMVLLDVSVKDGRGRTVTGLQKSNFRVFEDGHPRQIAEFGEADAPVAIGLVMDNSAGMRYKRPYLVAAGLAFAKESNPHDQFFVVNFSNYVAPGLPKQMAFTDSLQDLRSALYFGQPEGQTALYDAIAYSFRHLEASHLEKRTLIVVSDGGDTVSETTFPKLIQLVNASRATIYTVGLFDPEDTDENSRVLRRLARVSGGDFFQPASLPDVRAVFHKISEDIRSRYWIGYIPDESTDRHIVRSVKVVARDHGNKLTVRTRTSYTIMPFSQVMAHDGGKRHGGGDSAMSQPDGPVLIRYVQADASDAATPGVHSHNVRRRIEAVRTRWEALHWARLASLAIGISALGYYGYSLCDEYVYQAYENWAFDQQIANARRATFADYVRQKTPFGSLIAAGPDQSAATSSAAPSVPEPERGSVLGRVQIPRLHLSAMVREGVDAGTLSVARGPCPLQCASGATREFRDRGAPGHAVPLAEGHKTGRRRHVRVDGRNLRLPGAGHQNRQTVRCSGAPSGWRRADSGSGKRHSRQTSDDDHVLSLLLHRICAQALHCGR